MRSAIGLTVLTAGAILTFAVSAEVPGINLRLTGVIVMLAGIAGMISPARAAAWLHLHPLPHGRPRPEQPGPHEDDDDFGYSAYLLQDPAVLAAEVLRGAGVGQPDPGHGPRGPRGPAEQAANGTAGHDGHHGQG